MEGARVMTEFMFSRAYQMHVEKGWDLDSRAWKTLQIIVSEFETDLMSVQCFDLRTVEEAKTIIRERLALDDEALKFGGGEQTRLK